MIKQLSKELSKRGIYNKIEKDSIRTRKSRVKIPRINNDIIYLIGVIAGDGSLSMTKRKKGGYHYTFRIYSGSENNLKILNKLFKKYFLIKGKIIKDKRKDSAFHLVIKNSIVFFYFFLNGSEIGKKKGRLPKIIKKNKKYFVYYLAGLVDTDGHISNKRIQLKQKSLNLLNEIEKIANKLNLNCNKPKINYTNSEPYYYIRFDNKLPLLLKKAFKP